MGAGAGVIKVTTKGGARLRAHMKAQRAKARALHNAEVAIGYKGDVARLAAMHEYGSGDIPERPVIRLAARPDGSMTRGVRETVKSGKGLPGKGDLSHAALEGLAGLVRAYAAAHGRVKPVGATQQARKAGTPGAGKPLVGVKGPRMIEHASAWVDGSEV